MYQNTSNIRTLKILNGDVQMQILQNKLELAVKEEKYEKASQIQREIEMLKSTSKN